MVAKTTASRKAKGQSFQKFICEKLVTTFEVLQTDDCLPRTSGCNGTDIILSPLAKSLFPYSVEAKYQEKINLYEWWEQTNNNVIDGTKPLLIFRKSRKKPLVVLDLDDFLELIKNKDNNK